MHSEILRYEADGPPNLGPSFTGAQPNRGEISLVGEISGQAG